MAYLVGNVLHTISEEDLQTEMHKYGCKTKEELDDLLWNNYNIVLCDYKKK